ncbi:SMC-Scp complex subunit ScpB [Paracoccus rhizosphaerae]|uniref:SMC-Scp complex subunit ScpB n=1 Tax=Paracoccus rhizosphaerae TaxID=1133347 RepID=A0ABV6CDM4_9RHOB|nr:SMC-Scp complex subunit ScpB [Paracoccus rhizosphaerae]
MARRRPEPELDRDLEGLPQAVRWREWMCRIEAVLFASAAPVSRSDLARVVGPGASVDLLLQDLAVELEGRAVEVARVADGWMLATRPAYAPAIRAAAALPDVGVALRETDIAVLAAIAWHQPISRDGLKEIFGREISRELIGRLSEQGLIAPGPREPRRGAPATFVTTDLFLATFGLETLRDLPDPEEIPEDGVGEAGQGHVPDKAAAADQKSAE